MHNGDNDNDDSSNNNNDDDNDPSENSNGFSLRFYQNSRWREIVFEYIRM